MRVPPTYVGLMGIRRIVAGGAVVLVLAACGTGGSADETTADAPVVETTTETTPEETTEPPETTTEAGTEPASDAAVDAFADWYEAAAAEGGSPIPERLAHDDEATRRDAYAGFIRQLCAMNAGDPDSRDAAGTAIANDPEFDGDEQWARSAIIMARMACGMDE